MESKKLEELLKDVAKEIKNLNAQGFKVDITMPSNKYLSVVEGIEFFIYKPVLISLE